MPTTKKAYVFQKSCKGKYGSLHLQVLTINIFRLHPDIAAIWLQSRTGPETVSPLNRHDILFLEVNQPVYPRCKLIG